MHQPLRYFWLLFVGAFFFYAQSSFGQVALTSSGSYVETFDGITAGLPTGWSSFTGATATSQGNSVALTTAATSWNNPSGAFKNFASGDIGAAGTQASATDRALGLRQTGAFGDPGAAFAVQLANTVGYQGFNLTFKLQSLDPTAVGRQTTWRVDYGFGATPTVYTAIATSPTPLTTTYGVFANQSVTVNFGNVLDNQSGPVWIRIVTLAATTGSSSRASTGVDDFTLTYSNASTTDPTLFGNPATLSGFLTQQSIPSAPKTYTLTGANLGSGNVTATAPTGYQLSTNGTTYTPTLALPTSGGAVNQVVSVRMTGAGSGNVTGTITHTTGTTAVASVNVNGLVDVGGGGTGPCGTSQSILSARQTADGQIVTITGRLSVAGQFANGRNANMQDDFAGISVFDSPNNRSLDYKVGDLIQITGTLGTFRNDKQIASATCIAKIGSDNIPPTAIAISAADICNYPGRLVSVSGQSFTPGNFAGGVNYTTTPGNLTVRINATTNLVGASRPTTPSSVTGVVIQFDAICQLQPRFIEDVENAVANSGAACGTPTVTLDANQLNFAFWNVEWLGNSGFGPSQSGPGDATQITNVQTVMKGIGADVFFLEEVCDYNAANPADANTAFGKILTAMNQQYSTRAYAGECSAAVSGSVPDANPQRVCVVYRTDLVTKVYSRPLLDVSAISNASYPTGQASQFWASGRKPFLFVGQVNIGGVSRKVHFVGVHAKSGSDITSYSRRKYDIKVLYDTLVARFSNDLIIFAGDYNDDLDESIYLTDATSATTTAVSSYAPFIYTNPDETNKAGATPNANFFTISREFSLSRCSTTASYPDAIDHVSVSNEMSNAYVTGSLTKVLPAISNYTNTTSDHYPVFLRFNLTSSLPVQLVDFRASVIGDQVSLNWETTMEKDAAHFVVERSTDLREFGAIGQVASAGNSSTRRAYSLIDAAPRPGINYYRLRTIDKDGTSQVSKVVAATIDDVTPTMTVTGNPISDGKIRLAVRNMAGATYQLRTITGQAIRTTVTSQNDRVVELQLGQAVGAGIYLLEGNTGTSRQVVKLLADYN